MVDTTDKDVTTTWLLRACILPPTITSRHFCLLPSAILRHPPCLRHSKKKEKTKGFLTRTKRGFGYNTPH